MLCLTVSAEFQCTGQRCTYKQMQYTHQTASLNDQTETTFDIHWTIEQDLGHPYLSLLPLRCVSSTTLTESRKSENTKVCRVTSKNCS